MKPISAPDSFMDMPFPANGIDTSAQFAEQRQGTTIDAQNTRTFESLSQRGRGGSRPGLSKYVTDQILDSVIQHLNYIVDPAADALMANFAVPYPLYTDTSTNNIYILGGSIDINLARNPYQRVIRAGGSGIMLNRHVPGSLQRLVPVITWSDPDDIPEGTPLTSIQLNAVASDPLSGLPVSGTFAYSPTAGTILTEGENQTLATTFTPSNLAAYQTNQKTVFIDVTAPEAETHITQSAAPQAISHQTLTVSGITTASWVGRDEDGFPVAGTIELTDPTLDYEPDANDVPLLTVQVSFTPTDLQTYSGSVKDDGAIGVTLATWEGNGTIDSTDGSDADGRIIDVEITAITSSNLAVPSDFADVSDVVTAHRDTGASTGNPGPGNVGEGVGVYYDFQNEIWRYTYNPA